MSKTNTPVYLNGNESAPMSALLDPGVIRNETPFRLK